MVPQVKALSTCRTENSALIHPQGLELPIPASALPLKDYLLTGGGMVLSQLCLVLSGTRMEEKVQEEEKETVAGIEKKGETEIFDENEGRGRGTGTMLY